MASSTVTDYDRAKEVKEFDDSKAGVKGLLDNGITTIPRIFHQPAAPHLTVLQPTVAGPSLSIPTLDLTLPRPLAVQLASFAAREWGFFRVVNHGVPLEAISAALSAVRAFNELPTETKAAHYTRDGAGGVSFNSNFDLYRSDAASWRDSLQVATGPTPPDAAKIPEVCRRELLAWDEHALGLAGLVMGLLSEGLGVEAGRLAAGLSCLEHRAMVCHYYPYCPQPELTVGHTGHTDVVVLTVLVQNEVEGLLVRKGDVAEAGDGGEWLKVEPVPGTIVINVGDTLQMISNDVYKSVEHKVIANPHEKPRVSIATFFSPCRSQRLGPLPELVSEEKPARYREFTMSEVVNAFSTKKLVSKSMLNNFQL